MWIGIAFVLIVGAYFLIIIFTNTGRRRREAQRAEVMAKQRRTSAGPLLGLKSMGVMCPAYA
jgi:hypothetical protein